MSTRPIIDWITRPMWTDLDGSTDICLTMPLEVRYGNMVLVVPEGFTSDGASIPRILWRVVGPPLKGKYLRGAILHDAGYRGSLHVLGDDGQETDALSRLWCDRMFRDMMADRGVGKVKRWLMYRGVRLGGWKAFHDGHRDWDKDETEGFL